MVVRTAPAIYLLLLDKPSLSKRSPTCWLHPFGPVPSPGSWPTNFPLPSYCFTAFKLIIFIFYLAILSSSKEYHLKCLNYLILHHCTVLSIFRISTHYLRYVLQYVSLCHLPLCISKSFFIHTQTSSREFTSLWFYCLHWMWVSLVWNVVFAYCLPSLCSMCLKIRSSFPQGFEIFFVYWIHIWWDLSLSFQFNY